MGVPFWSRPASNECMLIDLLGQSQWDALALKVYDTWLHRWVHRYVYADLMRQGETWKKRKWFSHHAKKIFLENCKIFQQGGNL
ncbi:hypothetical protein FACS1894110_02040 [Spirochaetia bacterium]|nr:hypothetical protein FACS1894110_02040 [Spirochaetia bacterium]